MLTIQHLNKKYGKFYAVKDFTVSIDTGSVFGFVGHNGAGKTTTMKIIAGLINATSGDIYVDGTSAFKNRKKIKSKIGYMPDFFGVYDNLKAIEYMEFYASMYGITGKKARKRCLELMDIVKLSDKADDYVDTLSRGMKQRLCLARSLVHDPRILLLDEPASGLDPKARFEMKEIIKDLGASGKTIIVSSHILSELSDMCDTIGIMKEGKLLMHGSFEDIELKAMDAHPLHIRVLEDIEKAVKIIENNINVKRVNVNGDTIIADFIGGDMETALLLKELMAADVMVERYYKERKNLESLFIEITERDEDNTDKDSEKLEDNIDKVNEKSGEYDDELKDDELKDDTRYNVRSQDDINNKDVERKGEN